MNIDDFTDDSDYLLRYDNVCNYCNTNRANYNVDCCNSKLCETCYDNFFKMTSCPFCNKRVLKLQLKNYCQQICTKQLLYGILLFTLWYIVNFVALYLLQYYLYSIEIDVGTFIVLLVASLNSSLIIIVILVGLISCSITTTTRVIGYINGSSNTSGYISYDEL